MFDLYVVGEGANGLYSMFRHTFERQTRRIFNWASVENVNVRTAMKELDILSFEHQSGISFTGMPLFGFVLAIETVPGRSDVAHVVLLNGGGPEGVKGRRPGEGRWRDHGVREEMHNGIYRAIQDIASERGWRLYTPGDLARGVVQLPGFGAPFLPGQTAAMLGSGEPGRGRG